MGAILDELKHEEVLHPNPLGEEPLMMPQHRPRVELPEGTVSYQTEAEWKRHGIGFLIDQLYKRPGWRAALGMSEAERRFERTVLVDKIRQNSKESIARMLIYLDYGAV